MDGGQKLVARIEELASGLLTAAIEASADKSNVTGEFSAEGAKAILRIFDRKFLACLDALFDDPQGDAA